MEEQEALNPSITFNFDVNGEEHEFHLLDVVFDGFLAVNTPMSFYQDIIDFCKKRIDMIPHYEVVDGELEFHKD